MNLIRCFWLLVAAAGLLACSSDSRNEPSPAEMCKNLMTECSGFESEVLNECQRVGSRGLDDTTKEDACFVFYDTCIDQCRFYGEFGEGLPDAGADAGVDTRVDAGQGVTSIRDSGR